MGENVTFVECCRESMNGEVKVMESGKAKDGTLFADTIVVCLSAPSPIVQAQPHYKTSTIVKLPLQYPATLFCRGLTYGPL